MHELCPPPGLHSSYKTIEGRGGHRRYVAIGPHDVLLVLFAEPDEVSIQELSKDTTANDDTAYEALNGYDGEDSGSARVGLVRAQ